MSEPAYRIKLVRDRVHEVGPAREFTYRPVRDRAEHVELLRQKLGEEVVEYLLNPSLGELADVYEAIRALGRVDLGVDPFEIGMEADRKLEERGAFDQGLVMETVEP